MTTIVRVQAFKELALWTASKEAAPFIWVPWVFKESLVSFKQAGAIVIKPVKRQLIQGM